MTDKNIRCPDCGYTMEDAIMHGDHYRCKNANPPWSVPSEPSHDDKQALMPLLSSDIREYIRGLGLDGLEWWPIAKETFDQTDIVLLVTRWHREQFGLQVGKDCGGDFMTADDLSWAGPERYVVAWAEIGVNDNSLKARAFFNLNQIDERECSLQAWNRICNAKELLNDH